MTSPTTPINPTLCPVCQKAKASTRASKLCGTCHKKANPPPAVAPDLTARAALAKTTEDWQRLAKEIEPVIKKILEGKSDVTAAQSSLLKSILDRAYGKPVATQNDKKLAAGVIILPTLDTGEKMLVCPKCGYEAKAPLATE